MEDKESFTYWRVFVVTLEFSAILVNSFQFINLSRRGKVRSSLENILISITLADFLVGISAFGVNIYIFKNHQNEFLSSFILGIIYQFSLYSSTSHLALFFINKIEEIRKPTLHKMSHVNKRYSCLLIIIAWVLPILTLLLKIITRTTCLFYVFTYLLPPFHVIVVALNIVITRKSLRPSLIAPYIHGMSPVHRKGKQRSLYMTRALCGIFIISTVPIVLCNLEIVCNGKLSSAFVAAGPTFRPIACYIIQKMAFSCWQYTISYFNVISIVFPG